MTKKPVIYIDRKVAFGGEIIFLIDAAVWETLRHAWQVQVGSLAENSIDYIWPS